MEKPCVLVIIYGPSVFSQCAEAFIKKHFTIITYEKFTEANDQYAERIVAVFVWGPTTCVTRELIQKLPKLQVVASGGVGVDHVDIPMINSFGVKVCNTPHVVDNATADLGMTLMLASARKIIEGHNFSKYGESEKRPDIILGNDVSGATLGIIGMGRIGYKVAKRAQSFDMTILYHNRNRRKEEEERAVGAVYCEKMEELLQKSDFVMIVVNLSPQTHKLIGAKELATMKPSATLINISRGLVVDQDALVDALQRKVIKSAALDVTYPEPLPRDHPLLSLPNVIVLPHMGVYTVETLNAIAERMVVNVLAVLNGDQPPNEFGAEFRRFSLDRCKPGMFKDFQQFILRLHHLRHAEIFVSYADLHGDLLPINNNENFFKAVSTAQPLLRIIIQLQEEMEQATMRTDMVTGCNKSTMAVCGNVSREGAVQIGMPQNFRPVSSIIDVDILPGCHRRVRLYRQGSDRPLGFYIRDGTTVILTPHGIEKVPGIFVSRIVPGGLAESCGLLAVNDQVLEVNGIEVTGKSLDQVTDMMIANSCNLIITVKPANQCNNIRNPVITPSPRVVPDGEDSVSYPGLPLIMGSYIQMRKSYLSNIDDSVVVVERDQNPWLQCSSATLASPSPHTHYRRSDLHYSLESCRSQPCLNRAACGESSISLQREMNSQHHYRSIPSFRQSLSSTHDILSTLSLDLRQRLMLPHGAMEEDGIVVTL